MALATVTDEGREFYSSYPAQAVFDGLCDPVTPSMKQEPHPLRKIQENRFRTVWACGLVDQIVAKVLCGGYFTSLTDLYPHNPIMLGLGTSDEKVQELGEEHERICTRTGRTPIRSDVKHWDGHFSWVAVLMGIQIIGTILFGGRRPPQWWRNAITMHAQTLIHCVLVMPGGCLYVKVNLGIMPSGTYFTTGFNSMARAAAALAVGSEHAFYMGDDTNEWTSLSGDALTERYSALGLTIREVETTTLDEFEFCSHAYRKVDGVWKASLATWRKAVFKIATSPYNQEAAAGVAYEMRHNSLEEKAVLAEAVRFAYSQSLEESRATPRL
jgi:hypothetical protein